MTTERAFEAPDLIEVMEEAVNYNRYLIDEISLWSRNFVGVLDFGAGNGRFASALHERGRKVHAIEPDRILRDKIEGKGVATFESLEQVEDGQFQGIYSINVLEHLEDDRGFLRQFNRCLEPGGELFLYVPAFEILFSANDARVGHVRRYRRGQLVERVREAGFEITHARYVDSIGFVAGLGYRFFGNADGGLNLGAVRLYDRVVFPMSRLFDKVTWPLLGKNLLVRGMKPK
ncbi:MAG: class I SAM-dependent methyltransferase [Myxococcota bacterium]|nr:class I SAM-dependent methyltransferase [Myxococcota bacterium]